MALRGKAPTEIKKRCKVMFYGQSGVGKTTCALGFPKPYVIDTERGAENKSYVKKMLEQGAAYWFTADPDELIQEVRNLLSTPHDFQTLVIDPLSVMYDDMLDKSARSLASKEDPTGTAFSRHKGYPDRQMKHLFNLLTRLDMNVVIINHAKGQWLNGQPSGRDTFAGYSKADYLLDLVIEVQKRGKDRYGVVRKTRMEEAFPEGESFLFSYDEIAKRYGREDLERTVTTVVLATAQQIAEAERLVALLKIDQETVEKWWEKEKASSWEEMPESRMSACIEYMTKTIQGVSK